MTERSVHPTRNIVRERELLEVRSGQASGRPQNRTKIRNVSGYISPLTPEKENKFINSIRIVYMKIGMRNQYCTNIWVHSYHFDIEIRNEIESS